MFANFGEAEEKYCLPLAVNLRKQGISTEVFPEPAKMKKQMNYANRKNIPFVILIGSKEMETGLLTLKNMETGEQFNLNFDSLINQLK